MYAADMGTCYFSGALNFMTEPLQYVRFAGNFGADGLQGYTARFCIIRLIDFSHAATSKKPDNPETIEQNFIREEARDVAVIILELLNRSIRGQPGRSR